LESSFFCIKTVFIAGFFNESFDEINRQRASSSTLILGVSYISTKIMKKVIKIVKNDNLEENEIK
jgi:hypothetical protein